MTDSVYFRVLASFIHRHICTIKICDYKEYEEEKKVYEIYVFNICLRDGTTGGDQ